MILWLRCHGCRLVCRATSTWFAHRPYPLTLSGSHKCRKSVSNKPIVCLSWATKRIAPNWKNRCQMNRLMDTFSGASTNWRQVLAAPRDSAVWPRIYRAPSTVWPKPNCSNCWCRSIIVKRCSTPVKATSISPRSAAFATRWVSVTFYFFFGLQLNSRWL